jgi:hypothetical protein
MREDHSWDRSAREYVKIYRRALERAGRPYRPVREEGMSPAPVRG